MKQLGKGAFSTAYLQNDGSVLIKTVDRVKEAMANGFFPSHRLFPTLEHVDSGDVYQYYKMKFFPKVGSLKKGLTSRQYRLYKVLYDLQAPDCEYNDRHQEWHKIFDTLPSEFKAEREAIQDAMNGLSNYGTDISFEISPRNVAIQGRKLILLDCFFLVNDLIKNRKIRKEREQGEMRRRFGW
jgi:hypothetical protein